MITVWRRMPIPAFALVVVIVLISIGFVSAANLSVSPVSKLTASSNTGISITNPPVSTCTLRTANNDSYVDQSASSSTHDAGSLRVQSDDGGIFSGDDNERAFVAFAESPCDESGQGMEAGVAVISATLQLYMFNAPGVNLTYAAHRVTGASWTEGALTWSNQPAVAGSPSSSVATGTTANVWKSWDVTADVRLIVGGTPNYGWRISDSVESSSNLTNALLLRSGDHQRLLQFVAGSPRGHHLPAVRRHLYLAGDRRQLQRERIHRAGQHLRQPRQSAPGR